MNSNLPDTKICQWYCCSCGKSYGSVLYENLNNESVDDNINTSQISESSGTSESSARATDSSENVLGMAELNESIENLSRISELSVSNDIYDRDYSRNDSIISFESLPDTSYYYTTRLSYHETNVILSTPKRFVCYRCDHMMCPYCLKLRVRDLKANIASQQKENEKKLDQRIELKSADR